MTNASLADMPDHSAPNRSLATDYSLPKTVPVKQVCPSTRAWFHSGLGSEHQPGMTEKGRGNLPCPRGFLRSSPNCRSSTACLSMFFGKFSTGMISIPRRKIPMAPASVHLREPFQFGKAPTRHCGAREIQPTPRPSNRFHPFAFPNGYAREYFSFSSIAASNGLGILSVPRSVCQPQNRRASDHFAGSTNGQRHNLSRARLAANIEPLLNTPGSAGKSGPALRGYPPAEINTTSRYIALDLVQPFPASHRGAAQRSAEMLPEQVLSISSGQCFVRLPANPPEKLVGLAASCFSGYSGATQSPRFQQRPPLHRSAV